MAGAGRPRRGEAPERHRAGSRSTPELTEAAAAGLRWVAYARVAIEVLLLAAMVVLARLVPPAAFGVFAVVVIVQELAVTMPMEGIGGALVQRPEVGRRHLQAGLALGLGWALPMAAASALAAVLLVGPLLGGEARALTLAATPSFLLGAVYALPLARLRRRLDFRAISLLDVSQNLVRAAATVGLALAGLDAAALVFGSMAALAAVLVPALALAPVPPPWPHRREIGELLPFGGPAALATVVWTGFRNGDYAVVAAVLGSAQAGLYWRAYQLAVEYQNKIAVTMVQIAFPVLSRTRDLGELLALRQRMVRLQTVVIFPLLALLLLLAPVAVPWIFGPAWEDAVLPTQILVLGGAAALVINACGPPLLAAGRPRAVLGFGTLHFAVYVGTVLAVADLGLAAVALAGSVVHAAFLAVAYEILLRDRPESPLRVLVGDLAPALTACAALLLVAGPLALKLGAGSAPAPVQIALVTLAGGTAYLASLRAWHPASAHDLAAAVARILPARLRRPGRRGNFARRGPLVSKQH